MLACPGLVNRTYPVLRREKIRNTIFLSFVGSDHPSEDILQAL